MLANNETGVLQPIADVVRARAPGWRAGALRCGAGAAGKVRRRSARTWRRLSQPRRPTSSAGRPGSVRWWCGSGAPFASDRRGGGQDPIVAPAPRMWPASRASAPRPTPLARRPGRGDLRDRLEASLLRDRAQGAGVRRRRAAAAPTRPAFPCPGVKAETQVMALDLAGVGVSAGCAPVRRARCSRSAVLAAMGVEDAEAATAIRISCGWNTRIGRYRTLDRGLAGPIYPSSAVGYVARPGQPRNFKGLA